MKAIFYMQTWKFLNPVNREEINTAGLVLHHAAQFSALAGKYLVEQKPDDSNTNLEWLPDQNIFAGNLIKNHFRVGLDALKIKLLILDENQKILDRYPLEKSTRKEIFEWMKENLSSRGVDVSSLKDVLHYKIPPLKVEEEYPFKTETGLLQEWAKYRSDSELVLSSFAGHFSTASTVRIWPHHFDTGTYIPLEFDADKETIKSIGLGFAIADAYCNEPYFYINNWQKEGPLNYSVLPELDGQGSWNEKDWVGAILPLSALSSKTSPEEQQTQAVSFFTSGINQTLKLLSISKKISY